ncbi:uncharacterized protein LOC101241560 isoform X1 [Hydra vulgaris]|uniref:uncharacterized protein LOC101241560 isoform X1 n=1 Tax=Hydra vulgaris TaxID=6087 RepID=UPI001F5FB8BF|nr:rac-like GTP-binding protein ARAC5 isoform X1 [Hydra vulgaris]
MFMENKTNAFVCNSRAFLARTLTLKKMTSRKSCKAILLGDSNCGKTSLWKKHTETGTNYDHIPTVFEFLETIIFLDKNLEVKLTIWDTPGSSEFDHVRLLSFDGVDVFVLCFDLNLPESLENVQTKWAKEAKTFSPSTPIVLCGCKCDLHDVNKCDKEMIDKVIQQIDSSVYIECSSQNNKNVEEIFKTISLLAIGETNKIKSEFKCKTKKKNVNRCCVT